MAMAAMVIALAGVQSSLADDVEYTDAISREFTVYNDLTDETAADAVSRELTVFNDLVNPVQFTDAMSREFTVFPCIPIEPGVPYQGTMATGQQYYLKVQVPADLTVRVSLHHASPTAWTELYARFEQPPAVDQADFVFDAPAQPDQKLVIPTTQAGTYYILIRCTNGATPPTSTDVTILAQAMPFGLLAVAPNVVGAGEVTLRIEGGQLAPDGKFHLRHVASGAEFTPAKTEILDASAARVRFDLIAAPLGPYDLICERASLGRSVTLSSAVTVEAPLEPSVEVTGIPSPFIRSGHARNSGITQMTVSNNSNVDAAVVSVYILVPNGPDLSLSVEGGLGVPLTGNDQYVSTNLWFESLSPGEQIKLPVRIVAGPGFPGPNVQIYATAEAYSRQAFRDGVLNGPGGVVESVFHALAQPDDPPELWTEVLPFYKQQVAQKFDLSGLAFSSGFVQGHRLGMHGRAQAPASVRAIACAAACYLLKIDCEFGCDLIASPIGRIACRRICPRILNWCLHCCDDKCAEDCPASVFDPWECDPPSCHPGADCPGGTPECPRRCVLQLTCITETLCTLEPVCVGPKCTEAGASTDPNELVGPAGFGAAAYLRSTNNLPYRIYFENMPAAVAPAAGVRVAVPLDMGFDASTFTLGDIHIGQMTITVPGGRAAYKTTVDLSATLGVLVEVEAGVDLDKREAFWTLRSLDPATGLIPEDAFLGFLPPNDESGNGEGSVEYMIKPRADAPTGAVIRSRATIVFDFNDPIDTNEVSNTIDAGAPASSVKALPPLTYDPNISLEWAGEDDVGGSGIATYTIYVSTDGGPYTAFLTNTTDMAGVFAAQRGHSYAFYSAATDIVGNAEAAHATPDAVTFVPSPGDLDGDRDVDMDDVTLFVGCITGPNVPYDPAVVAPGCALGPAADVNGHIVTDFDHDGDVDQADFGVFQRCWSGSDKPPDPDCAT